ncbi:MAG TPA: lysylphosphatidylglycerol synthase domain-containing protein [Desulfuromonadales bacterium]|nr:lysylphosphatidylglycerol synthase domain-containing protein [Desulfuromonadales bacterium]
MKKFHNVSIAAGLILLVFLIWSIGPRTLWHDLIRLGWGVVPLVLSEFLVDLLHTFGWRRCLSSPYRQLPFWRIFGIRMAGTSINFLTPTASLGGEVTKGTLLYMHYPGVEATTGVIIGKLAFVLAQLVFVVIGSLVVLPWVSLPAGIWTAILVGGGLLGLGVLGFLLVQKYGKLGQVVRWMVERRIGGKPLANAVRHLTEVDDALRDFYRAQPHDLPLSVLWHVTGFSVGIFQAWFFLHLVGGHASLMTAAGIWLLGTWFDLIAFAVPFDLGVQEGTRILVFRIFGFSLALGLTYGIYLRIQQITWAGIGMLIYWGMLSGKRKQENLPASEMDGGSP